jgi:hypothetical protein
MNRIEQLASTNSCLATNRSGRMLPGYLLNMGRGAAAVRDMILDDIRRFSELGASGYVTDLVAALCCFDSEFPSVG